MGLGKSSDVRRLVICEKGKEWNNILKIFKTNSKLQDENITKNPTITVSRSHSGDVKEKAAKAFGADSNILIAAGSGYKVLQVVNKNATIYLHTTRIKKWDICAGDAILSALGGRMSTLENDSIDYSKDLTPVNDKGLLATLGHHDYYFNKYTAV